MDTEAEDASTADALRTTGQGPCERSRGLEESTQRTPKAVAHALRSLGVFSLEFGKPGWEFDFYGLILTT